jgi:hypothetical protein
MAVLWIVVIVVLVAAASVVVGRGGSRETFNMNCSITQNEL